jgi:hypothetical protein
VVNVADRTVDLTTRIAQRLAIPIAGTDAHSHRRSRKVTSRSGKC